MSVIERFSDFRKKCLIICNKNYSKPEKFPLLDFKQANPAQSAFNIIRVLLFSEQAIGLERILNI